jgi:predicted RNA-binding protein YlxR (DUF448 family)
MRTCISCRTKRNKSELIRFVLDQEDRLVRDDLGKRPGRGTYVCRTKSCLHRMGFKAASPMMVGKLLET